MKTPGQFLLPMLVLCSVLSGKSQAQPLPEYQIIVQNRAVIGSTYQFDLFVKRTGSAAFRLGNSQFIATIDAASFSSPSIVRVSSSERIGTGYFFDQVIAGNAVWISLGGNGSYADAADIDTGGNGTRISSYLITGASSGSPSVPLSWVNLPSLVRTGVSEINDSDDYRDITDSTGASHANTFTVTAAAGAHGAITPPGMTTVIGGHAQSYTFLPDPGYHVDSVIVDELPTDPGAGYTFANVTEDHTIRVTFAVNYYIMTATAGSNGTITPLGSIPIAYGDSVAFSIVPDPGYHISDVVVDGISVGAVTAYTIRNVSSAHTILASFTISGYTITATAGPHGAITPSGGVGVNRGDTLSFSIAPAPGYHVDSVFVDGVYAGSPVKYTFADVRANHTIVARFAVNVYTITATAGPNGSINPSGGVSVNHGAGKSFSISPAAEYHVDSVFVDGVYAGAIEAYTFADVTMDHTIRATFAINTYVISASALGNGTIDPAGAVVVTSGASRTFTFTAGEGAAIESVLVDGSYAGVVTSYTFTGVTANHSIVVRFAALRLTITVSAGAHGSIFPLGTVKVDYGSNINFIITPDAGYDIDSVIADGIFVGKLGNYWFTSVTLDHSLRAAFSPSALACAVAAGWNMVSLPRAVQDARKEIIYPTAVSQAFAYEASYVIKDTIECGSGYWLKFAADQNIYHGGVPLVADTIAVREGWNLIGSINMPVAAMSIEEIPPGIVTSVFFGYEHGYVVADTIVPGRSYWVKTGAAGSLELGPGGLPQRPAAVSRAGILSVPDDLNFLTVEGGGGRQELRFGRQSSVRRDLDQYELPPPPPDGAFDVRFLTNRSAAILPVPNHGAAQMPLSISPAGQSFSVSWSIRDGAAVRYALIGRSADEVEFRQPLNREGSTTVVPRPDTRYAILAEPIPTSFGLDQNYPNPFNPKTDIRYRISDISFVTMKVYDVLGREVATLVNEKTEPGEYTIQWDGSNQASGVYFCRVQAVRSADPAKTFVGTKKMILAR